MGANRTRGQLSYLYGAFSGFVEYLAGRRSPLTTRARAVAMPPRRHSSGARADAAHLLVRRCRRLLRPPRLARHGLSPVSDAWGLDRGTPIDRYYIASFLEFQAGDIRGRCLEVRDTAYTDRFGDDVRARDVIDIDPANPRTTFVTDLAHADNPE